MCAIFDWNDRDQLFDRAKDAFEISSIFLISVFGLFKLTSEDPNALKNLACGRYLVEELADACRFLRSSSESVQKVLSIEAEPAHWAKDSSYGRAVYGEGLDLGPARVATFKQCGFFFLEGICKQPYFWDDSTVIEKVSFEVAQVSKDSELVGGMQFVKVPPLLMLAWPLQSKPSP